MTKTLAGLLLAISTTASAQFNVEENISYLFRHNQIVAITPDLKLGESIYTNKVSFCREPDGSLYVGGQNFQRFQTPETPYKLTLVSEKGVALTHALEPNGFMLDGPAVKTLHALKSNELIKSESCNMDNMEHMLGTVWQPYKVETLFGHVSYIGLAEAVKRDLETRYGTDIAFTLIARTLDEQPSE
ncbi:hypothetical protein EUZ85_27680 [Hahella sp. KA22]|uniref:hypothetical protein n=1 Tax=Hahella sp. KA22 TaxID=1628392 RepID=UPI000FDF064B|nr:hypothetical protein [Hahella sp. KA22]AZZ94297.1 hypothetical protein ENC22_25095 [Hahella sp. KA22]QAY57671.1 hypothetical protein EUZ85_27680 [Hahella sp. KA22]